MTAASVYSLADTNFTKDGDVFASITNTTNTTYYSRLGNRFNSSIDQKQLAIVVGATGFVQRLVSDAWLTVEVGLLTEGVRFVALRPDSSYRLLVPLSSIGLEVGTYRIKIDSYSVLAPGENDTPISDYSNLFIIE
ncbi:MAG: hypothetical protein IID15_07025 [Candidatus Marinimicrobia bacterium]|nr:hypothetical protein [Candidatus Neomarinimicrobiota bacterium]